jgi:ABC-2 type transport system ATP-binding protein
VAVSVHHLSKRFPTRRGLLDILQHPFRRKYTRALRDVSCDVRTGEFFGLLGPNGAGKTTLFKILSTLVIPDKGTATVNGFDVRRNAAAVRGALTPVIADERSLRWRLTARENLRLFAVLYGIPSRDVKSRVDRVLKIVDLEDTGRKLIGEFSTGMKQRLLVARALLPSPRILLLDEPTRGLDPLLARSIRTFLRKEIGERQGCTVLLATHNTEEAFELCDRVAILNKGRLLVDGTTDELIQDFGEARYRIWTREPNHAGIGALSEQGVVQLDGTPNRDADGWARVDMVIPGGSDHAARVMDFLVAQGVVMARFEQVGLSLAELIERVVARGGKRRNA